MAEQRIIDVAEQKRLSDAREKDIPWKKWGPYLSERQWGTVREDYSEDGNVWDCFSHDQSRSRTYRWGEDGMGGISDDKQWLCFAPALWNGHDPILKERLYGLTNSEANHGEDVKEFEYEPLNRGAFADDRYFDVFAEYAKEGPEDVLIRITVHNRGPKAAQLRLLPTLWFRNTWSWGEDKHKPYLREAAPGVVHASHHEPAEHWLYCDGGPELLFTENETNTQRLWGQPNASPYVKDAFHAYIISGQGEAVNPAKLGTKVAPHYMLDLPAGGQTVRLRLATTPMDNSFRDFEKVFTNRIGYADEFYQRITPKSLSEDERRVHRQALAGMMWGKQYYYLDLEKWLTEHKSHPLPESARKCVRNTKWFHMLNVDVISMPDNVLC